MADRVNPLLNNLVAKEILKYSTLEDLAAHRLVCQTWFEESLTRWRSTATLIILQEERGSDSGTTLQELRNIFSKGGDDHRRFLQMDTKPFAKYRLKKWKVQPISKESYYGDKEDHINHQPEPRTRNLSECPKIEVICGAENFPLFWQKIGPLMRSLTVEDFEFGLHHHNPLLAITFEHTPNLAALKFSRCDFPGNEFSSRGPWWEITILEHWKLDLKPTLTTLAFDGAIPVHLEEFLRYFPNLENLALHRWNSRFSEQAVEDVYCRKLSPNLKHLDILHHYESNEERYILNAISTELMFYTSATQLFREDRQNGTGQQRVLPLKIFEHGSVNTSFNSEFFVECISETLDTYAGFGGLEVIKLYMAPFCEETVDLEMTRMMQSAKHFEVWGNWLQSLGFLRWMPNLETLEVHISCFEKRDQMPQLKQGYTDYRGEVGKLFVTNFNEDIVQNALLSYPTMNDYVGVHLKCLHIDYEFDDESLYTLSKWMPHLKELKTILNNGTLRTVCGLWTDLEKLDLLYGSLVDDEGITGIIKKKKTTRRRPKQKTNLTNLKKLKSFRMETYCDRSKLGDISATEAFLKMDTLQFLEICVSPQMSVDAEAELKKAIPNAKIIRNYGAKELAHRRYGKCCKRRQFLCKSVESSKCAYLLHDEDDNRNVNSFEVRRSKRLLKR